MYQVPQQYQQQQLNNLSGPRIGSTPLATVQALSARSGAQKSSSRPSSSQQARSSNSAAAPPVPVQSMSMQQSVQPMQPIQAAGAYSLMASAGADAFPSFAPQQAQGNVSMMMDPGIGLGMIGHRPQLQDIVEMEEQYANESAPPPPADGDEVNLSYLERLWQKRRETTKLVMFGIVVALGLSIHALLDFYNSHFIEYYKLSFKQIQIMRWCYPLLFIAVLGNLRAFFL